MAMNNNEDMMISDRTVKTPTSNTSSCQGQGGSQAKVEDSSEMQLWALIAASMVIAIMGIIGNGAVIYFSTRGRLEGTFRHLNKVVRNLAITDFLFSILAVPLQIAYWYLGKSLRQ